MSRVIKFRAWDKEEGRMGSHDEVCSPMNYTGSWLYATNPNWVLMQFTGLIDKKGKDIYEGDIIQRCTGYVFVMEVCSYQMGDKTCASCYGWQHHPDDVIIGNIYENPELLQA